MGERVARKGFLLEILRGYNSWGPCTRFGLGGPKGYLWSWVVGETSPVGRVAKLVGLVEFPKLGKDFGCRDKARRNGKQGHQQRWI